MLDLLVSSRRNVPRPRNERKEKGGEGAKNYQRRYGSASLHVKALM
jgi:hypothetical protein